LRGCATCHVHGDARRCGNQFIRGFPAAGFMACRRRSRPLRSAPSAAPVRRSKRSPSPALAQAARRTTLPDDTRRALPPPVTSGMADAGCGRFLAELGARHATITPAISDPTSPRALPAASGNLPGVGPNASLTGQTCTDSPTTFRDIQPSGDQPSRPRGSGPGLGSRPGPFSAHQA